MDFRAPLGVLLGTGCLFLGLVFGSVLAQLLGSPSDIDFGESRDDFGSNFGALLRSLGGRIGKTKNCVSIAQARMDCMSGPPEELPVAPLWSVF